MISTLHYFYPPHQHTSTLSYSPHLPVNNIIPIPLPIIKTITITITIPTIFPLCLFTYPLKKKHQINTLLIIIFAVLKKVSHSKKHPSIFLLSHEQYRNQIIHYFTPKQRCTVAESRNIFLIAYVLIFFSSKIR